MGKRVNYEIVGDEGSVGVTLYANNSHSDVEPDDLFVDTVRDCRTLSQAVSTLLAARYPTQGGNHRAGAPVFTIDLNPGDREYVVRARVDAVFEGAPEVTYFEKESPDGTIQIIDPHTHELFDSAPTP